MLQKAANLTFMTLKLDIFLTSNPGLSLLCGVLFVPKVTKSNDKDTMYVNVFDRIPNTLRAENHFRRIANLYSYIESWGCLVLM